MRFKTRNYLMFSSLLIFTSVLPISCSVIDLNKRNNDFNENNKDNFVDDKHLKFAVKKEWANLEIQGQNIEEWVKIQKIYDLEISRLNEEMQDLDELENEGEEKEIKDLMVSYSKTMLSWYGLILNETLLNIYLLNNGLGFDKVIQNKDKKSVQKIILHLNKIINNDFNQNLKDYLSFTKKSIETELTKEESDNWNRVRIHLELKNNFFSEIKSKLNNI